MSKNQSNMQRRTSPDYQTALAAKDKQIEFLLNQAGQHYNAGLNLHTPFESARASVIGTCMSINTIALMTPLNKRQLAVLSETVGILVNEWRRFGLVVQQLEKAGNEVDFTWLNELSTYVNELRKLADAYIVDDTPQNRKAFTAYCDRTTTQLGSIRERVNIVPQRQRDMEAAETWLAQQLMPAFARSTSKAGRGLLTGEADSIYAGLMTVAPAKRTELQAGVLLLLEAYQPENRIRYRDSLVRLCKRWEKKQKAAPPP